MVRAGSTLSLLLILVLVVSCGQSGDVAQEREHRAQASKGDITVGVAAPWTRLEAQQILYWQGIEMALDEINQGGGVLGRKIRLIKEDDEGTVTKGRTVAQEFADNLDVVAVIGHFNYYISIPASITYQFYGVLMLCPSSTATGLRSPEGISYVFRTVQTSDQFARRLAELAQKRGYKRLVTYYVNNDYGRELANAFETHATELGHTIVDRLSYDSGDQIAYLKRDLEHWKRDFSFDAVLLAGVVPEAAEIIAEARRLGINAPILGGSGLDYPDLWRVGGDGVDGTIVATYFNPDEARPEVQAFNQAFSKRYERRPDQAAAKGYDALKLLAHAIKQAGTTGPREVAGALAKTKGWVGVTGSHTFNDKGDVVDKPIALQIVRNKKFELLKE